MIMKLKNQRGFTLVELMIVVAIIGILAALAIYGVRQYVNNSKTAEARTVVGRIGKDAASAFGRDTMSANILAAGASTAVLHSLCTSSTSVPATVPQAAKYQSSPADWGGSGTAGWTCLRFSMADPQYYQYTYTLTGTGTAANDSFVAQARGDLDADGTQSVFALNGQLQTAAGQLEVFVSPTIAETQPLE